MPAALKMSVTFGEEATSTLRELSDTRGIGASQIVSEALSLYRYLYGELHDGAQLILVKDGDDARERVQLVFTPNLLPIERQTACP